MKLISTKSRVFDNALLSQTASLLMGVRHHKETIQIAYLTGKTKEIVKEQQIKHDEGQIKKFINKLKSEYNEVHCCYEAGVTGYDLVT